MYSLIELKLRGNCPVVPGTKSDETSPVSRRWAVMSFSSYSCFKALIGTERRVRMKRSCVSCVEGIFGRAIEAEGEDGGEVMRSLSKSSNRPEDSDIL